MTIAVGRVCGVFAWRWNAQRGQYKNAVENDVWGPWPGCEQVEGLPQPGDIFMSARNSTGVRPWHCGIVGKRDGKLTLIHAQVGKLVQEDDLEYMLTWRHAVWRPVFPPQNAVGVLDHLDEEEG